MMTAEGTGTVPAPLQAVTAIKVFMPTRRGCAGKEEEMETLISSHGAKELQTQGREAIYYRLGQACREQLAAEPHKIAVASEIDHAARKVSCFARETDFPQGCNLRVHIIDDLYAGRDIDIIRDGIAYRIEGVPT